MVSYDAAVSDDDKAQEIYADKELAADIPSGGTGRLAHAPAPVPVRDDGPGSRDGQGRRNGARAPERARAQRARPPTDGAQDVRRPLGVLRREHGPGQLHRPARAGRPRRRGLPQRQTDHRGLRRTPRCDCGLPHVERDRDDQLRPVVHRQDDVARSQELQDRARSLAGELVERPQRIVPEVRSKAIRPLVASESPLPDVANDTNRPPIPFRRVPCRLALPRVCGRARRHGPPPRSHQPTSRRRTAKEPCTVQPSDSPAFSPAPQYR